MKLTKIPPAALLLACLASAMAQETNAPAAPAASANAEAPAPAPPRGGTDKKDEEMSAVNPSTGAVTFNGFSWNIGDLPALDMRYERFLMENQSLMKDEKEYYHQLQSLIVLLTGNPFGKFGPQAPSRASFEKAFLALQEIENKPDWRKFDGGVAGQIATQVEALSVKLRESRDTKGQAAKFEARRRNLEASLKFLETDTSAPGAVRRQRLLEEKARLQTERAAYEAESLPSLMMAKAQFQVYIFTLLAQRRFQHVVVAAKLYQALIADGDLGMSQKNNPVSREMNLDADLPLTTISVAQAASMAHEDVRRGVEAYENQIAASMLDAADRTLHAAFMLGEYMPEVRALPAQARMQILAVRQARKQLNSALNARDYAQAKTKVEELAKLAPDFDATANKTQIAVETMKSDAFLLKGKNALFDGDQAAAENAFREAAKIWPTNPAFEKKDEMSGQLDEQMKLKKELDNLLARADYRLIADRAEKFAAAVHDDPDRQKKLRSAMDGLKQIERALAKYEELSRAGSHYAAWEALEEAAGKHPKDEPLALAYQEATVKASDYIGGVRAAQKADQEGEDVAALAAYLAALSKNPTSESVKASVKRLSRKLMDTQTPAP